MIGTPLFLAPEVWETNGKPGVYTPAVDIYALGVSTYRILSGEFPFENKNA